MYLNLVVVLLLTGWAAANDCENEDKMKEKMKEVGIRCCNETGYADDKDKLKKFMERMINKESICKNEDANLKNWATCVFKALGAINDESNYVKGVLSKFTINEHKTNMDKCEQELNELSVEEGMIACTVTDCMNKLDVKPCYQD